MFKFSQMTTLMEKKQNEAATASVSNDDKGKLHELLLAKHLHPKGTLPEHHRSESENPDHAGTPQQVHDKLKSKISPAAYKEIHDNAKKTAAHIVKHLKAAGHLGSHEEISNIHWTSNRDTPNKAGDHEKTTGIRDPNSNADLIVSKQNKKSKKPSGFVGVSAKYGSTAKPNLKNSGMDVLEKAAGHKKGAYTSIMDEHHARMEKLGYKGTAKSRHIQHKEDLLSAATGDKKAAARVKKAEESSHAARTQIASLHAEGMKNMAKMNDKDLRNHIRENAAPKTSIPHVIAHSKVDHTGSGESHVYDPHDDVHKHLDQYEGLHVVSNGTNSNIMGKHKVTGKIKKVAFTNFKANSGPHKGVVGVFKLA